MMQWAIFCEALVKDISGTRGKMPARRWTAQPDDVQCRVLWAQRRFGIAWAEHTLPWGSLAYRWRA